VDRGDDQDGDAAGETMSAEEGIRWLVATGLMDQYVDQLAEKIADRLKPSVAPSAVVHGSTERAQSEPKPPAEQRGSCGIELRGRQSQEGASTQAPHSQTGGRVEAPVTPFGEAIDLLDDARYELRCASGAIHRAPITETRIKEVIEKISAFLARHPADTRSAIVTRSAEERSDDLRRTEHSQHFNKP
jgi:hypothetical protein